MSARKSNSPARSPTVPTTRNAIRRSSVIVKSDGWQPKPGKRFDFAYWDVCEAVDCKHGTQTYAQAIVPLREPDLCLPAEFIYE